MDAVLQSRIDLAQTSIIGALLIDDRCIGPVLSELSADDFPSGPCKSSFQRIRKLFLAGQAVDPVTLLDAMQGGQNYAKFLTDCMDITPTSANVMQYCQVLKRSTRIARIAEIASSLVVANDMEGTEELVGKINALMVDNRDKRVTTAEELSADFIRRMESGDKPEYVKTGIKDFDEVLTIELGDLVGIGAAPSTGKTAFALQWASHICAKYRVGFYSLETSKSKIADRTYAQIADVPLAKIKYHDLDDDAWMRIANASAEFSQHGFDVVSAAGMGVDEIISNALSLRHQVIFVDYVQLVAGAGKSSRTRYEIVTEASMAFHSAAQKHGILIVLLSQITVKDSSAPPDMHSFRESGQLTQDVDVAMMMYLADKNNYRSPRHLKLAKNKDGEKADVLLSFDGAHQRFSIAPPDVQAEIRRLAKEAKKSASNDPADKGLTLPEQLGVFDEDGERIPF